MAGRKEWGNKKRKAAKAVELSDTDSDRDMCVLEYIKKKQTCLPVMPQVKVMVERLDIRKLKNNVKVSGVGNSGRGDMERSNPVVKEGFSTFPTVMPEVSANDLQVYPPESPVLHTTMVDGSGSTTYKCFVTDVGDSDEGNNVRDDYRVRPEVYYVVERFTCEDDTNGFKEAGCISNEVVPRAIERDSMFLAILQQSASERPVCPPQSFVNQSIAVDKDISENTAETVGISNINCDKKGDDVEGSFSEDVTRPTYSPVLPHFPAVQQTTCPPTSNSTQGAIKESARLGNIDYNNAEVVEKSDIESGEECDVITRDVPIEKQPPVSANEWPTSIGAQGSIVGIASGRNSGNVIKISIDSDDEEEGHTIRNESVGEKQQQQTEFQQCPTIRSNKQLFTLPRSVMRQMPSAVGNGVEPVAVPSNRTILEDLIDSELLKSCYSKKSTFKCIICEKVSPDWVDMQLHLKFHFEEKAFQCNICGKRYCFEGELDRHIATHSDVIEFSCDFCVYKYYSLDALKRHLFTHFVSGHWLCTVCSQQFPTFSSLVFHFKQVHGTNIDCKICGEKFYSFDKLKEHFPSHFEENSFICKICGKEFSTHSFIETHLQVAHYLHLWNCACEDCLKKREQERNEGTPEKYICDKCGKEFLNYRNFNKHYEVHTDRPYKCDMCPTAYVHRKGLTAHKRQKHADVDCVTCHACRRQFPLGTDLTLHLTTNCEAQKFHCEVCGKTFRRQKDLKEHALEHCRSELEAREVSGKIYDVHMDWPYKCDMCPKAYFRRNGLAAHKRLKHAYVGCVTCHACRRQVWRQTNIKQFSCPECRTPLSPNVKTSSKD